MRLLLRLGRGALLIGVLLFLLFPFYYALLSSLRGGSAIFDSAILPFGLMLENYPRVFSQQAFGWSIVNSVLVALFVVVVSLLLALGAGYALGRVQFRGRRLMLITILAVSMFPQIAVLSGMFELVRWMGLYNHRGALMFSYLMFTLPFTVWIIAIFMRELPAELEEAARVDGAGSLTVICRIFLPVMWPAMVSTGLLAFIVAWNEFLFALTFTLTSDQRTVPVAIALISGSGQHALPWGNIMAASITVTVPLVLLVVLCQRRLMAGLAAGAFRG